MFVSAGVRVRTFGILIRAKLHQSLGLRSCPRVVFGRVVAEADFVDVVVLDSAGEEGVTVDDLGPDAEKTIGMDQR